MLQKYGEYLIKNKPALFVFMPLKVNGPGYETLGIESFELCIKKQVGDVFRGIESIFISGEIKEIVRNGYVFISNKVRANLLAQLITGMDN